MWLPRCPVKAASFSFYHFTALRYGFGLEISDQSFLGLFVRILPRWPDVFPSISCHCSQGRDEGLLTFYYERFCQLRSYGRLKGDEDGASVASKRLGIVAVGRATLLWETRLAIYTGCRWMDSATGSGWVCGDRRLPVCTSRQACPDRVVMR